VTGMKTSLSVTGMTKDSCGRSISAKRRKPYL
jgi:hypothetical protein